MLIIIYLIFIMQDFLRQYKAIQKTHNHVSRSKNDVPVCRFKAPKPSELVKVQYIQKE